MSGENKRSGSSGAGGVNLTDLDDMPGLERFHFAQERRYEEALTELAAGRKASHWMWFIFPQLRALGRSETAKYYGLADLREARDYAADPVLGARLRACASAVLAHPAKPVEDIMGKVDALKLRSSMTLFDVAGTAAVFAEVLDVFYGGLPCSRTLTLIAREI